MGLLYPEQYAYLMQLLQQQQQPYVPPPWIPSPTTGTRG